MRSNELATIGFEDVEGATVATIEGEVDMSNADRLLDDLMARVGTATWLVIDLTACSYLDSAGLRVIARVDLRCRDEGSGLRLVVERAGAVDRVLSMTRMSEVLTVDHDRGAALVAARGIVDAASVNGSGQRDRDPERGGEP